MHYMLVGQQISVGCHDDTRSAARGYDAIFLMAADVHADDCRADEFNRADDRAGIGIQGRTFGACVLGSRSVFGSRDFTIRAGGQMGNGCRRIFAQYPAVL
jgi:hypothetical protein